MNRFCIRRNILSLYGVEGCWCQNRFLSNVTSEMYPVAFTRMDTQQPKNVYLKHNFNVNRNLSSSQQTQHQNSTNNHDYVELLSVLPEIFHELKEACNKHNCGEVAEWFYKSLQYNVPSTKRPRSLYTVTCYNHFFKTQKLPIENKKLSLYLGWCVEMLFSFFLVHDDIIDKSTMRYDRPCWYKVDDVGIIAVNDGVMIESAIFKVLKQHFGYLDCYKELWEQFHDVIFRTAIGQAFDYILSKKNVSSFAMESYKTMVIHKTGFSAFYLPIEAAMLLAGIKYTDVIFQETKSILFEIAYLYQLQNDFLDCFGDTKLTGKIGTDIQENKCTWLSTVCNERATNEQKTIMIECYGQNDLIKVNRVKKLYKEMNLIELYTKTEKEMYQQINQNIKRTSYELPRAILFDLNNNIYRRKF